MNPMINLNHLKFFCDAVTYNSISEAAKMNYVTQSTISQAIIKLEKIVGVEIISHTRKKFQITPEGEILFEQAQEIFQAVKEAFEKIHNDQSVIKGDLKFVSTNSLGMSFLAPSYKKLRVQFPYLNISFRLGGLNFIRNSLRRNEADFAIVVYDQDFNSFSKHPLYKGKFNLYKNKESHPCLIEKGIMVDYFEGMYVKELKEQFPELKISMETAGWEVAARFTDMNIGIGFFPDYIVANHRYPNIICHSETIRYLEYQICLIYNKGQKLSRGVSAFIDLFTLSL